MTAERWAWRCLDCDLQGIARSQDDATLYVIKHYDAIHPTTPPPPAAVTTDEGIPLP